MFDDNCSLHTAAAISNILFKTKYTVDDIQNKTGFMVGSAHGVNSIAEMFRELNISDGT